jgi:hypothetical protein
MDDVLLDCCFNAVYEGLKFRTSTLQYAAVGGLNNNISININIKYSLCGLY